MGVLQCVLKPGEGQEIAPRITLRIGYAWYGYQKGFAVKELD